MYEEEKKERERKEREASKYYRKKYPIQELYNWYNAATMVGKNYNLSKNYTTGVCYYHLYSVRKCYCLLIVISK